MTPKPTRSLQCILINGLQERLDVGTLKPSQV